MKLQKKELKAHMSKKTRIRVGFETIKKQIKKIMKGLKWIN